MKYIKVDWKSTDVDDPSKIYYEVDDKLLNTRIITFSKGLVKVANEEAGFAGQEIAEGPLWVISIDELNNPPELVTIEISKEEFETEWQKATSQPGFELKPYEWLEEK